MILYRKKFVDTCPYTLLFQLWSVDKSICITRLLEMQNLKLHLQIYESESTFNRIPKRLNGKSRTEKHCPEIILFCWQIHERWSCGGTCCLPFSCSHLLRLGYHCFLNCFFLKLLHFIIHTQTSVEIISRSQNKGLNICSNRIFW